MPKTIPDQPSMNVRKRVFKTRCVPLKAMNKSIAFVAVLGVLLAGCTFQAPQFVEGKCTPEKGRLWNLNFVGFTEDSRIHVAANASKRRNFEGEGATFTFLGDFKGSIGQVSRTAVGPIVKIAYDGKSPLLPGDDYNGVVNVIYTDNKEVYQETFHCIGMVPVKP
ncbi:MAG TPA: hypothetical protein VJA40_02905 [archaeon]|nr:hypothetical protein [archaeon]